SEDSTDPIAIQVLRFDTSEVLKGELNGPALEVATSFASSYDDQVTNGASETYASYTNVSDDSSTISVDIPSEWSDVDGSAEDINGVPSPSVWAAPDLEAFENA